MIAQGENPGNKRSPIFSPCKGEIFFNPRHTEQMKWKKPDGSVYLIMITTYCIAFPVWRYRTPSGCGSTRDLISQGFHPGLSHFSPSANDQTRPEGPQNPRDPGLFTSIDRMDRIEGTKQHIQISHEYEKTRRKATMKTLLTRRHEVTKKRWAG